MSIVGETYRRPEIVLPDTSCAQFIEDVARATPDRLAIIDGVRKWTYRELVEATKRASGVLARSGLGYGDRILISLPTSADYFIWSFAALMRGGVIVPVYENAPPNEFFRRLVQSDARLAVVSEVDVRVSQIGHGATIVGTDAYRNHNVLTTAAAPATPDSCAFLFYSSGSTGQPKAIPLTHRNILAGRLLFAQATVLAENDILVHFLPPVHIYGWMAVTAALGVGATVVLHRRYDFDAIVGDIERYGATAIFGVPRLIIDLEQLATARIKLVSTLRFVNTGSAPLAAEIMADVVQRTGVMITGGYGLSEAAPTSHAAVDRPDLVDLTSVGYPTSLTKVRLIDPSDPERPAASGIAGELAIAGPQIATSYLNPDGSIDKSAWTPDGWFRTGDLVEFDDLKRLRIVGRLKSLIKYNGYSIVPAELESVLASHPEVRDCAVLGRPDPLAGEIPVAFIVARSQTAVSAEDLAIHVRNAVSAQRSPREFIFVNSIPRSDAGKVIASELLART